MQLRTGFSKRQYPGCRHAPPPSNSQDFHQLLLGSDPPYQPLGSAAQRAKLESAAFWTAVTSSAPGSSLPVRGPMVASLDRR